MAQYSADDKLALERLVSAEDALTHRHNLSPADRDVELASILRIRAGRAAHGGTAETAQAALNQLGGMAAGSRNRVILEAWHGAAGEMLIAQGKFQEAIPELEEDQDNPETLALLVKAYAEVGAAEKSKATESRLRATNVPSLEQALSVNIVRGRAAELRPASAPPATAAGAGDPAK
jgi:hypothetical protein